MFRISKAVKVFFALSLVVAVFAILAPPAEAARTVARSSVRSRGFGSRGFGGGVQVNAFAGHGHGVRVNNFGARSFHSHRVNVNAFAVPVPVQTFAVPVQTFGIQSFGVQMFADPCIGGGVGVSAFGFGY
jgi:hypothetical protein